MEAMKIFNEYIGETKVLANLIGKGNTEAEIVKTLQKIESLKIEYLEHVKISDESRPD